MQFLSRMWTVPRQIKNGISGDDSIDTLFWSALAPHYCLGCSRVVGSSGGLCSTCWSDFSWITRPFCTRMGTPFSYPQPEDWVSPAAEADPPPWRYARSVALYRGLAKRLILRLKFGDELHLVPRIACWMERAASSMLTSECLLVPVPVHRNRAWTRRMNQSALLAREISRISGLPWSAAGFQRVRHTRPQVGLSSDARVLNVKGAFRLSPSHRDVFHGREILLIDDVLTSGATARACTYELLRNGVKCVDVLTFALVSSMETRSEGFSPSVRG